MEVDNINNIKITVIIPVYNVEKYLKQCLDSVYAQTFKQFEVIAVDDGSTDHSSQILEKYDKLILVKKENGGLSSARNAGLQLAKGEYILFLDSDDYIEETTLEDIYYNAEKENADHIIINHQCFSDKSNVVLCERFLKGKYQGIYKGKELFCRMVKENEFLSGAPYHIIKRENLEKNNMRFLEGVIHEDELFGFQCYMNTDRVLVLDKPYYHYRIRENSIMRSKTIEKSFLGYLKTYDKMIDYIALYKVEKEERKWIGKHFFERFSILFDLLCQMDQEKRAIYQKNLDEISEKLQRYHYFFNFKMWFLCKHGRLYYRINKTIFSKYG